MSLILSLETSTTNCSVSLSKEGETLLLKEDYNAIVTLMLNRLHVFIDDSVLKEANVDRAFSNRCHCS